MKKTSPHVTQRSIARAARVSVATVSFALNNQPEVSSATRERIIRIANGLGYVPDARIGQWMARVRDATSKELLPIAWLNTCHEKDAWQRPLYQTPYMEGARARALELGYKIEDIWVQEPGMTMQRLAKSLYQRGVEGVILTYPARHFRLQWDHLASVVLGQPLLAPKLHRISADFPFNLLLAFKSLRRLGYRRIGVCLAGAVDTVVNYSIRLVARDICLNAPAAERVPPLLLAPPWRKGRHVDMEKAMIAWLKRYAPEVIVGHDNHLKQWVEAAGYRVPEDIGIVHLAVDDDVLDWAGIHSRKREMGATAVEQLVSMIRSHQFGLPKTPLSILIRGSWQTGATLDLNRSKTAPSVRKAFEPGQPALTPVLG
jgi:LacI family transcriptional regulator